MTLTREELQLWRAFCEWLDARHKKCAHTSDVPPEWRELVSIGGHNAGKRGHAQRVAAGVIFYQEGWGWRLRANWQERLDALDDASSSSSGGV